jgi:hypothetical protein
MFAMPQKMFNSIKKMGKIWGVWCKDVQCLMMGKSNHIKILNLNFFIIISLPLEYKKFCKALIGAPIKFK